MHHQIEPAVYRAATVLLLTSPATPLLFMGQEWGPRSPFLYFTDHQPELGRQVTQGRRREFEDFSAFSDPQQRDKNPDPQAEQTFLASRLNWDELEEPEHAALLRLYRRLLALRRNEPALASATAVSVAAVSVAAGPTNNLQKSQSSLVVTALNQSTLGIRRDANEDSILLILVHFAVSNATDGGPHRERIATQELIASHEGLDWSILLTTGDGMFAGDPGLHVTDRSRNVEQL